MSMRIESSLPMDQLANQQLEKMQANEGWHGDISLEQAKARLLGQDPFTYLLTVGQRPDGSKDNVYRLVWITQERLIEEKMLFLEHDLRGPFFRNCVNTSFPTDIMSDKDAIDKGLLSKIMQCNSYVMMPLKNVSI
jgi:hypothetical protein